ncbi:MAG: cupin [Bdellovibrionales bacterium RIFOXYC1_FULL_54_43]|nr:MAG: cupin [Bdellovibrionales bacterium RIFOXYC1_FULL_54_43]OFZ83563.1 MAG: cupin [Bdellovibrionales bacterium RIFOXYD1_FULL_55_31]
MAISKLETCDAPGIQKIEKPWGYELIWAKTRDYVGKVLHINRGHKLSLQFHQKKEETIFVQSGRMTLIFETDDGLMQERVLCPGQAHHIPPGRKHRMIAIEDCDVFEVSTPHLDDVVRLEDGYGRIGTTKS